MQLNDLSVLMKMEKLELCWLMQDKPSFFKPKETRERWSACVATIEKIKGVRGRSFGWGYFDTPEGAVLAAIDYIRNPPQPFWERGPKRKLNINLDDLEIEL